jgi:hypothetical protein
MVIASVPNGQMYLTQLVENRHAAATQIERKGSEAEVTLETRGIDGGQVKFTIGFQRGKPVVTEHSWTPSNPNRPALAERSEHPVALEKFDPYSLSK